MQRTYRLTAKGEAALNVPSVLFAAGYTIIGWFPVSSATALPDRCGAGL